MVELVEGWTVNTVRADNILYIQSQNIHPLGFSLVMSYMCLVYLDPFYSLSKLHHVIFSQKFTIISFPAQNNVDITGAKKKARKYGTCH